MPLLLSVLFCKRLRAGLDLRSAVPTPFEWPRQRVVPESRSLFSPGSYHTRRDRTPP
jgi:hypothetical protein